MRDYCVTSYFLVDENSIPVEVYRGSFPDEYYIEGWIDLSIGVSKILGRAHWDLVDQLWVYLVDGTTQLTEGQHEWETFFPDQPLRLALQLNGANKLAVIVGDKQFLVKASDFREAISHGGVCFFRQMKRLLPSSSDVWNAYIAKSNALFTENSR